jgi:hypothetical protein
MQHVPVDEIKILHVDPFSQTFEVPDVENIHSGAHLQLDVVVPGPQLTESFDVVIHFAPYSIAALIFKSLAEIVNAEGYFHRAEVAPDILGMCGPLGTVGVVVYLYLGRYAAIHHALEHVKVFLYHEWFTTSELYVTDLI